MIFFLNRTSFLQMMWTYVIFIFFIKFHWNIISVLIKIAFLRNAVRNFSIFLRRFNSAGVFFKQNTIENILND